MSTIAPTRKRTMRCRNRSASIVNVTPAPPARVARPTLTREKSDALPERMHARVGASGARRRRPPAHQTREHCLELRLHRAPIPLPLPPHELGPVVVHHGEVGPARHGRKIGGKRGPIKPRNPLWYLTKGDFSG